jgi:hypothetical protein
MIDGFLIVLIQYSGLFSIDHQESQFSVLCDHKSVVQPIGFPHPEIERNPVRRQLEILRSLFDSFRQTVYNFSEMDFPAHNLKFTAHNFCIAVIVRSCKPQKRSMKVCLEKVDH